MASLFENLPPHRPRNSQHADLLLQDARAHDAVVPLIDAHQAFFAWLVEGSPFLARLMRRYPDVLLALQDAAPEDYLDTLYANLDSQMADIADNDAAMALLRHARNRAALAIALADLADKWDVETVTKYLTRLADLAVRCGLDFLLREAVDAARLTAFSRDGLVVLALGKHGGEELNYSSDIDFVIYYTPDALPLAEGQDRRKFHVKLVQDLTALLQNPTADGFVFRVDLRLRPDPGATPVTISVDAALGYYESMGQNWERAVYIKARPIAGDLKAGQKFIDDLQPYIWRRYFDFAAIEDVHSMKRQMHTVRGHAEIVAQGHNLKLGRGGIREIEFFVQTQQLIAGGRDSGLRGHRTVEMLTMLAAKDWISHETAERLTTSYYYLRRMEHRLQMRLDEQTQTLPKDDDGFAGFACFAGYQSAEAFADDFIDHLKGVTAEYGQLFEQAESLSGEAGNLVFTGGEDDPETLETLSNMGFRRPADISGIIRGWHAGRMAATRSARAREILTRLQPVILNKLAEVRAPDDGFIRFDQFLTALPAGVQIFSLFQSNPHVLNLLIDIINSAPRLAALLSGNARLVDALVPGHMPQELPVSFDGFEAAMDGLRRHVHEAQFRVGTKTLADPTMATSYGEAYSRLAETAISTIHDAALADMERQYGRLPEGDMMVLGLGKLGSGEMTLQSDLDLILICDCPDFSALSDGDKPLDADRWFARAARRLMSGLSAPSAEGELYEVDTRLRPSGNAGPLVTKFSSFVDYQLNQAWNWEHMALTRGRVLAGGDKLRQKVEAAIGDILSAPRDMAKLAQDAEDMRQRLRTHQPQAGPFDIRRGDGGLVDVEFIAQSLQLAHGARHKSLLMPQPLPQLLSELKDADCLDRRAHDGLQAAAACFLSLRQIASLCLEDNETAPPTAIAGLLLEALNEPDMSRLSHVIEAHRAHVAACFDATMAHLRRLSKG
ncbi:MAG: bifunctional [glutamine synthetase] adenylyltransferase/[glutamine synthetase]-adenylyl-L-tyrosine phosphorylase [Alphaproteobacteria bacterium]|nr:bifunctional [glutamine synthetase] adenylyltransferase/[glutamine synthetase]-adenylyl-L-tyrosine phosphorylase [Alphaproteobacteria bacterium]